MELSNYQAFMECMRKWEKIGCNILCGLALWEQMQDCDRRGVPYTDMDVQNLCGCSDRHEHLEYRHGHF